MQRDRPTPGLGKEWLDRARENLELSRHHEIRHISLSLLAFHAQQAGEIAIKAVYHHQSLEYERTHNLEILAKGLEDAGILVSDDVKQAVSLTRYAVHTRYPGMSPPVTPEEYHEAIRLAQAVVDWARELVESTAT